MADQTAERWKKITGEVVNTVSGRKLVFCLASNCVAAEISNRRETWTIWLSRDFKFVFSMNKNRTHYYLSSVSRSYGGTRRTTLIMQQGEAPSSNMGLNDGRMFELISDPATGRNALKNIACNLYLVESGGKLKFVDRDLAQPWYILPT